MNNRILLAVLTTIFFSSLDQRCLGDETNFKTPSAVDYPAIKKEAPQVADFVPENWIVLGQATGDLNGDKLQDTAIVIKGNIAKYKQKNTDLGSPEFDTNPRLLLILLKKPDGTGFELIKQTKNIVACGDSPTMEEPFQSIAIKNGVLNIAVRLFYSAGSWGTSNTVYRFQNRGGAFVLIGVDQDETQRNTGEEHSYSYNFLTGKMQDSASNIESNRKGTSIWKRIPGHRLKNIDDFQKLYEWEVMPDHFL